MLEKQVLALLHALESKSRDQYLLRGLPALDVSFQTIIQSGLLSSGAWGLGMSRWVFKDCGICCNHVLVLQSSNRLKEDASPLIAPSGCITFRWQ